jgi:site-specific recombinase XerD
MDTSFSDLSPEWRQVVLAHLQKIENRSGSTKSRATYAYHLARFFAEYSHPSEATRADILAYQNAPGKLPYAPGRPVSLGTQAQRLTVLSSFFKFASAWDLPSGEPILPGKSPTVGIEFPHAESAYRGMTLEEVQAFFKAIPDTPRGRRDHSFFSAMWWTGRRRSELISLQVKDIRETTVLEKDGTTRQAWLYQTVVKGHARGEYVAEMPAPAMEDIRDYWRASGRTLTPESFVWTNVRHSQNHLHYDEPLCGDWVADSFTEYASACGLDIKRVSLHSLRRSAALTRYQTNPDLEQLRIFLGHSSVATSQRYIQTSAGVSDPGAKLLERKYGRLFAR